MNLFEEPTTYAESYKWPSGRGERADLSNKPTRDLQAKPPKMRETFIVGETHAIIPTHYMTGLLKYVPPEKINETQPIFDFRNYGAVKEEKMRRKSEGRQSTKVPSYNCINVPLEGTQREEEKELVLKTMYKTETKDRHREEINPLKMNQPPLEKIYRPPPAHINTSFDPEPPLPLGYKEAAVEWDKPQTRCTPRINERFWGQYKPKPPLGQVLRCMEPPGLTDEAVRLLRTGCLRMPYVRYLKYGGHEPSPCKTIPLEKPPPLTIDSRISLSRAMMSRRHVECLPEALRAKHSEHDPSSFRPQFAVARPRIE